jgi:hypothetical protein
VPHLKSSQSEATAHDRDKAPPFRLARADAAWRRRNALRSEPEGGKHGHSSEGIVPRAIIECQMRESRVTMTWSTTGMPSSLPAAISLAVVVMSTAVEAGSPPMQNSA